MQDAPQVSRFIGRTAEFHLETQVGAVERRHKNKRVLQSQARHDILARRRSGGSCQREDGRGPQRRCHVLQGKVGRPEIIAPLADTMRLVDDEKPGLESQYLLAVARDLKTLRGDIKESRFAGVDL